MGIYEDFILDNPDLSNNDLADIIQASGKVNAKLASIRGRIRATKAELREEGPTEKPEKKDIVAESVKNPGRKGDRYEMDEEAREYVFTFTDGRVLRLSYAVMQSIYERYVNPRALTIREVVRSLYKDFGVAITENDFRRLKKPLGLTKASLPFAPHAYQERSESALKREYLEICESKLETKIRAGESKHWYKKFEEEKKKTLSVEAFFARIHDELPRLEVPVMEPLARSWDLDAADNGLIVSDWHVGKFVDREFNQYNIDVFHAYMRDLERQIKDHFLANRRPVETFYIFSVGDLLDGVSGDMHPHQDRHQDVHGAQQVLYAGLALSRLAAFCKQLLPDCDVKVEYVVGNHDRVTKDRRGDPSRIAGEMVFYMARETCPVDVDWTLHQRVVGQLMIRNTQVFLTHGDKSPKNFRKIIHANRNRTAETHLVISGHLHHLNIVEDLDMLLVQGGSLPGQDDFAGDTLGVGSRASQAMLEIRDDGPRPLIWLPLKSDEK